MKSGMIQTTVPCDSAHKAAPAFAHLLKEANCAGVAICSGIKIKVAFSCASAAGTRKLKRSVEREVKLFRRHGLAGRRKKK